MKQTDPASGLALASPVPDRAIGTSLAWRREDVGPRDWRVPVSAAALAELDTIADATAHDDDAVDDMSLDALDWPAITEMMTEVRYRLTEGVGFAVLDRLPVDRWTDRASRAVAWAVNSLLATPMHQKQRGVRVYDVRDTGATLQHGVRRSITNLEQEFHTDGSWLALTPDIISLVCLRPAEAGGESRVASLATVHDVLREREPERLARLYRPYWWDRQAEHDPGEVLSTSRPVYEWVDGRPVVRYYDDYIRNGHRLIQAPLDDEANAALAAIKSVVELPENRIEFRLEAGQIEFVNNHVVAHARTAFRDRADRRDGRMLLRFWLRSCGAVELDAEPAIAV